MVTNVGTVLDGGFLLLAVFLLLNARIIRVYQCTRALSCIRSAGWAYCYTAINNIILLVFTVTKFQSSFKEITNRLANVGCYLSGHHNHHHPKPDCWYRPPALCVVLHDLVLILFITHVLTLMCTILATGRLRFL